MTGTSLDGIDVAFADFELINGKFEYNLLAFNTYNYPEEIRNTIKCIIRHPVSIGAISKLNFQLAGLYADAVKKLCNDSGISLNSLDAIGMHGQTIWHEPGGDVPNTLQIGSHSALANILCVPVIGDFRSADVAAGGQGAPLVPVFDYAALSNDETGIIVLNIGGIANITYMPPSCQEDEIIAFDTGPGNVLIDAYMTEKYGRNYDDNGNVSASGNLLLPLFEYMKQAEFIGQKPPKSTGRELFNSDFIRNALDSSHCGDAAPNDIIRTLTQFTVWSIAQNVKLFADGRCTIVVSGGGARNSHLIELLKAGLPESKICLSDDYGIPGDAKEAICFAYLAWRTLGGLHSNIPNATGAGRSCILGTIALPFQ
ncbi:MAG: Anhydro-N-acetylmuramic acid kinase [Ignavibacteria bacterium]|nr:Anhydro-N-acetylmuramic acid kinase [Ignavibacteria bacterium]